jgi:hypothetical protein
VEDTAIPADLRDLDRLRERVRSDRRTVSAPLVVFGVLGVLHAAVSAKLVAAAGLLQGLLVVAGWSTSVGMAFAWLSVAVDLLAAVGMLIAARLTAGAPRVH